MASRNFGLVITGPTGVGKTELAVRLAERIGGGELISCDSVQVYRHLCIGANKTPTGQIPQHMLDLVEPSSPIPFTAADWYEGCMRTISEIRERQGVPILVGGTGFYLEWVLRGRPAAPPTDPATMEVVDEKLGALGSGASWADRLELLRSVDPVSAARLNSNDTYRLKRALAVFYQTGKPLSTFSRYNNPPPVNEKTTTPFKWHCFYLTGPREVVSRRIDARCEEMVQAGLVDEVIRLIQEGHLVPNTPAARSIGYEETFWFLDQLRKSGMAAEVDRIFREYLEMFMGTTRGYARRQESWFRKAPEFTWINRWDNSEDGCLDGLVERIIASLTDESGAETSSLWSETDRQTRKLLDGQATSRIRRTYQSVLTKYGSSEDRKRFLQDLMSKLQQ